MVESQSTKCDFTDEDRLSRLPDEILYCIYHGLQLKDAVRTSRVSTRYKTTWLEALAASAVLDFTDRDVVGGSGQTPARAAATVTRCLMRHEEHGGPLHMLRVALNGVTAFIANDVVGWVADAVARGAREVAVDLTPPVQCGGAAAQMDAGNEMLFLELPDGLFAVTNSLERLALDQFSLRAVPPDAAGLRSLYLSHADVTDEGVETVLSGCHSLAFLSLRRCHLLESVRIVGDRLRGLEIVSCLAVEDLRVTAPALESFAFHGEIVHRTDLGATPLLRDVYLSHVGYGEFIYDGDYSACSNLIRRVAHARSLTMCSVGLTQLFELAGDLDMDMNNIQELQLLIGSRFECCIDLFAAVNLLKLNPLPLLDRLFIRLLLETRGKDVAAGFDWKSRFLGGGGPSELGHVRLIKIVNVWGKRKVRAGHGCVPPEEGPCSRAAGAGRGGRRRSSGRRAAGHRAGRGLVDGDGRFFAGRAHHRVPAERRQQRQRCALGVLP